ncbi:terminase small subunit [Staphylococcus epidermidis]|jgi:phage terminase small subunit|uniref:terminase small subunit n=1 Tax=Bacillati TaxID=1783272 RepID=UPI00066B4BF9|nr:terminase small subunit [Staphylococcus epidermidis]MEB2860555.1 terminase small subunit [Staphylococcus sp. GCP4]MCG2354724.1 terminase small subunit [Staphylococcus epidermidis]MCG2359289.1 terminase small subunit [Staphylococcus epidermidis]MCG2366230.1 terminase small subunit [Staphylococcus epidermidis]MCG2370763.1 terminase small subunit [Staphylococcus epidermidis]
MTKLNLKQQAFVDEYIKTGTAYQSAIRAGYSEKYAKSSSHKLLENVGIKAEIDKRMEKLKKDSIADQDEILQYLTSVLRGEVTDQELIPIQVGRGEMEVEELEKRSDTNARTKAAELLGKRYMMWTDKQQIETTAMVHFDDDIN